GAGLLLMVSLLLARLHPLGNAAADLAPSLHWPAPSIDGELEQDSGPVLVTVEYQIRPEAVPEFFVAMQGMRRIRKRDGAIHWGLYEDSSRPGLVIETFTVESWLEHLRQHERVTNADRVEQDAVSRFHIGETPPLVRHFVTRR